MELEVAGIEVGQAGMLADHATLDRGPGHEQARSGAVIGAAAAVLVDAAAEFRKGQHTHAAIVAGGLQ